jgi:2-hydroxychromene-2-carboxylate isomerase
MRENRSVVAAQSPCFYFGAMSPYSWMTAERIDELLPHARWCGVLLQAVFKSAGRTTWGLTEDRERGIAESEQRARAHGLGAIVWPDPWPTSDLLIARAMTYADGERRLREFALEAMRMEFREGAVLSEPASVREAATRSGLDADALEAAVDGQATKDALRASTDEAIALGVIGVPTLVVGERLFWGDDRLLEAVSAARA